MSDMIKRLPLYYRKSKVTADLYDLIEKELSSMKSCISQTDMRLFIVTTDDVERHEYDVGLYPISTDIETRRARVIARLQGNGALTVKSLSELVSLYEKTGCSIEELFNENTVVITFDGRVGIPYNLDELNATIEELKPAHIQIEYAFLKNTWNDARRKVGTWNGASKFTWDGLPYYDGRVWMRIDSRGNVYLTEDMANAFLVYVDSKPYARFI